MPTTTPVTSAGWCLGAKPIDAEDSDEWPPGTTEPLLVGEIEEEEASMRELTNRFIDALHLLEDQGQAGAIIALFSQDAVLSNPFVTHGVEAEAAPTTFWTSYRNAFQAIESKFFNVLTSDDVAVLEWISEARIETEPVTYRGVSVLESRDGAIVAFRAYFDPRQLQSKAASVEPTIEHGLAEDDQNAKRPAGYYS